MLPIHRSNELASIQFVRVQDGQLKFGEEEVLRHCGEWAILWGKKRAAKDMIHLNLDPRSATLDEKLYLGSLGHGTKFTTNAEGSRDLATDRF
jgi:hypothetical protein